MVGGGPALEPPFFVPGVCVSLYNRKWACLCTPANVCALCMRICTCVCLCVCVWGGGVVVGVDDDGGSGELRGQS